MTTRANKTVTTSLPQDELTEFDRVREAYHLTRAQAMREAIRQYIAAGTRRIPVVDPEPGELEAIARGEYVTLAELLHELDADRRELGAKVTRRASTTY
jgi:metal-responsive CopG/Arc/MetJ family transcriptional regulator